MARNISNARWISAGSGPEARRPARIRGRAAALAEGRAELFFSLFQLFDLGGQGVEQLLGLRPGHFHEFFGHFGRFGPEGGLLFGA
jgi:hypothetical protein